MEWKVKEISGYLILWDAYRHCYVIRKTSGEFVASCDSWDEVDEEIEGEKNERT